MRRFLTALACGLAAGACGSDEAAEIAPLETVPVRTVPLDESKVLALSADFAIHKGLTEACEGNEPDHLSAFFADLQSLGASAELIESARLVATEMYDMARKEEPEYVCTPEMHEGIAARVSAAWLDWDDIRMGAE